MNRNGTTSALERAVAYARMSTDHQEYSTENQLDFIRQDARRRGLEIVKTFSDDGKSGLDFSGRDALKAMIAEVESGQADYSHILVYDVSRWGRYQDPDESAHYEYICRKAGVAVHYCAEPFENDGSSISAIVKSVKRAMAGEFSRELSKKVYDGHCRLVRKGFRQGGVAGYGFRRLMIDHEGRPQGHFAERRTQEPANRPGHHRARPGGGNQSGELHLRYVH